MKVYDAESCVSLYDVVAEGEHDMPAGASNWMATSVTMKLAFASGGSLLAVAFGGPQICLYVGLTGAFVLRLLTEHTAPVSAMAWHMNGTILAAGYNDGSVRSWSIPEALTTIDTERL